jgi:hypothetical protein
MHHDAATPRLPALVKLSAISSFKSGHLRGIASASMPWIPHQEQRKLPSAVTSATPLALPWSLWPTGSTRQAQVAATTSYVDSGANLMAFAHTKTYASLGFQGGQAQQALLPIGGNDSAAELWLGTYYSAAVDADAAVADAASSLSSAGVPATACGASLPNCYVDSVGALGQGIDYAVFAEDDVVGEVVLAADQAAYAANATPLDTAFATLVQAAVKTVTAAISGTAMENPPLPTSVAIDSVMLTTRSRGVDKPAKSVPSTGGAYFTVVYQSANAGSTTASARLILAKGSKKVAHYSMFPATTPAHITFFIYEVKKFPQVATGALTAKFTVTLGTATASQSLKFSVTARKS